VGQGAKKHMVCHIKLCIHSDQDQRQTQTEGRPYCFTGRQP